MNIQTGRNLDVFFTQKELALRWKVTQTTLKNWRDGGILPFFQVPMSSKILYPVDAILEIEKNNILGKEVIKKEATEKEREKPVVSSKPKRKWRV